MNMGNKNMKKSAPLILTGLFLSLLWVNAQQKELKVLFVGNSYTYGYILPHIVSIISAETSTKLNTWAREKVPQFQAEIDAMYRKAAGEYDAIRVPVGPAWELAMDLRPSVDLFTSDGSHPNELGCMLSASVFVREISGELPEQVPTLYRIEDARGESVRLMNHNPEDAEFCRRIANEVHMQSE